MICDFFLSKGSEVHLFNNASLVQDKGETITGMNLKEKSLSRPKFFLSKRKKKSTPGEHKDRRNVATADTLKKTLD